MMESICERPTSMQLEVQEVAPLLQPCKGLMRLGQKLKP